jgi:hypothetical protein
LGVVDEEGSMLLESVSAAEVLEAIMNSTGMSYEQMVVDQSMAVTEVTSRFFNFRCLKESSSASKRKLTSHRIVTSTEIKLEKLEAKQKKEREIEIKEEQKQARKLKQEQKRKTKKQTK